MSPGPAPSGAVLQSLRRSVVEFLSSRRKVVVLTGAGVSTSSGIPDYRDETGDWKPDRRAPITYQNFIASPLLRQRYWARSMVGWSFFEALKPTPTHLAIGQLGRSGGPISTCITQNVDGLHSLAGSRNVVELHGTLHTVRCLECRFVSPRVEFQSLLLDLNPDWVHIRASPGPDGDALLREMDFSTFVIPKCGNCGATQSMRPNVVLHGENTDPATAARAMAAVNEADGILVCGTSLHALSALRLVRTANQAGTGILSVNLGRTRGDDLITQIIHSPCDEIFKDFPALIRPYDATM